MTDHQQWQPNQPPPPGAYTAGPPTKKNWFMRHKILTLLLGLLLVGGVSVAASGGGETADEVAGTASADDAASAERPKTDASTPQTAAAKKVAPKRAARGDAVRDGKFEFVVTKVEDGPKQIGDEYLNEKPQGRFVLITVKVTNIGDEARQLSDSDQKLFDHEDRSYLANSTAAMLIPDNTVLYENVNPGNSVTGTLVFDIPNDAEPGKIELHDSPFSGGVTVQLS